MLQTSNSLLSNTKLMVARVNQGQTGMKLSTTQSAGTTSKYASNLKFSIITHFMNGCYGQPRTNNDDTI